MLLINNFKSFSSFTAPPPSIWSSPTKTEYHVTTALRQRIEILEDQLEQQHKLTSAVTESMNESSDQVHILEDMVRQLSEERTQVGKDPAKDVSRATQTDQDSGMSPPLLPEILNPIAVYWTGRVELAGSNRESLGWVIYASTTDISPLLDRPDRVWKAQYWIP